ncbi:MAG: TetR/AcrR family transcriptional regulator [Pseudomonadota bacterium]
MTASDAPEPKTREQATRARRAKIIDAALACFLEAGFHQTGVRDIAKRAGVSLGNVYNHFPGKNDILVEIAAMERAALTPFIRLLAEPSPPAAKLNTFVSEYLRYLTQPHNVVLSIEITREAIRQPELGALFLENRAHLASALSAVLQRGVDAGDFRDDLDAVDAAKRLLHLMEAAAFDRALGPADCAEDPSKLRDFIALALRR